MRMGRAWLATVLLLAAYPGHGVALAAAGADSARTTVYVVRHCEKNQHAPGGDAGLNARGIVRAQDLARTLRDAGLDAIYSTQFPRSRLTAEPIARALGDSVRIYEANDPHGLVQRIRDRHRGQTVLIVGHTDTIPHTLEELLHTSFHDETVDYDELFVVTLGPAETKHLLRLRYGAAP